MKDRKNSDANLSFVFNVCVLSRCIATKMYGH